jgi:hypothetical protein
MFEDAALPKDGFLGFEGPSFIGIPAAEGRVREMLIGPPLGYDQGLPGGRLLLTFVIVQTVLYAYKGWWFRYSLDGWPFDLFWVITATITYGGLFFLLLRFLAAWYELHRLLQRLSIHPTRGCYGAMRKNRLPEEPRPSPSPSQTSS